MRYVSTRGAQGATLQQALFDGLAPDGGLYLPDRIERWPAEDLDDLPRMSLVDIGARVLAPFAGEAIGGRALASLVADALNFSIPLVELEPGIHVLELFHGPTLAFKDIAARVMARLFSALSTSRDPLTVLVATSGDTGGAVANAFSGVPGTRVVVLYPDGRISRTQEAQLTMFNGEPANVRAYAVDGTFDDCQRLVKTAFGDAGLRRTVRLTSANSINIGRLLPQMIYYFHAVGQVRLKPDPTGGRGQVRLEPDPTGHGRGSPARPDRTDVIVSTPSGNFGNLTAGVMAKRAGVPIDRFIAATNVNDVVPAYLRSGRFEPRPSIQTIANAMDVGHPSNFERLSALYHGDVNAMRAEIAGSVHADDEVRETIRRVYEERGYLLDPHSAIGYLALKGQVGREGQVGQEGREGQVGREGPVGILLATAHPAKFREIVEPIVGRRIEPPPALAEALAKPKTILNMGSTVEALREVVGRAF